jgi:hypothetical protein
MLEAAVPTRRERYQLIELAGRGLPAEPGSNALKPCLPIILDREQNRDPRQRHRVPSLCAPWGANREGYLAFAFAFLPSAGTPR